MFQSDQYQEELLGRVKQTSPTSPTLVIDTVLEENNLKRRQTNSNLFSAFSIQLYQTKKYSDNLLSLCINYLKNLTNSNSLNQFQFNSNQKLSMFRNNYKLYQDYCQSPTKIIFEKINCTFLSTLLHLKVIIYCISEDQFLNCFIINKNYNKQIELLRIGQHYDIVYSMKDYENLEICQTLAYELSNDIFKDRFQKKLAVQFKNLELEFTKIASPQNSQDNAEYLQFSPEIIKSRHKKSMSETFKTNFDSKPRKDNYYNLFSGINIPQDFFQTMQQQEPVIASQKQENEEDFNQIFFNDGQIENMKQIENERDQYPSHLAPKSPIYFINASPPGITPPKHLIYKQKQSNYPTQVNQSQTNNQQFPQSQGQSDLKLFQDPEAMTQQLKQLLLSDQPKQASQIENPAQESAQEQSSLYAKRTGVKKIPMLKTTLSTVEQPSVNPQLQYNQQHQENEDFQSTAFTPQTSQQQYQQFSNQNQQQQYYNQQKMRNFYQEQQQQQQQQNYQKGLQQASGKKPPVILDENKDRQEGYLKFFDENKNYGFLVMDIDKSDIFVHFDDMSKIGITKEFLKTAKSGNIIRFSFCCLAYMGKYNRSRKAVELELLPCQYD